MIKSIRYKIDKYDNVGLRSNIIIKYNNFETDLSRTYIRVEALVMFGKNYSLLRGIKTNNNIFNVTNDYSKSFYFPFLDTQFIGKAIVKLNRNYEILSIALSEVDYSSFPLVDAISNSLVNRKPGIVVDGEVPVMWKPVQLTETVETAVRNFVKKYII